MPAAPGRKPRYYCFGCGNSKGGVRGDIHDALSQAYPESTYRQRCNDIIPRLEEELHNPLPPNLVRLAQEEDEPDGPAVAANLPVVPARKRNATATDRGGGVAASVSGGPDTAAASVSGGGVGPAGATAANPQAGGGVGTSFLLRRDNREMAGGGPFGPYDYDTVPRQLRQDVESAWAALSPEEWLTMCDAVAIAVRHKVEVDHLAWYSWHHMRHLEDWERRHAADCDDADCPAPTCRRKRGLEPLPENDWDAQWPKFCTKLREQRIRRQMAADRRQQMIQSGRDWYERRQARLAAQAAQAAQEAAQEAAAREALVEAEGVRQRSEQKNQFKAEMDRRHRLRQAKADMDQRRLARAGQAQAAAKK
jgi:hypothetical protein